GQWTWTTATRMPRGAELSSLPAEAVSRCTWARARSSTVITWKAGHVSHRSQSRPCLALQAVIRVNRVARVAAVGPAHQAGRAGPLPGPQTQPPVHFSRGR